MSMLGVLRMGRARTEGNMTETLKSGPLVQIEDPDTLEMIQTVQADQQGIGQVKYPTLTVSEREIPGEQVAVGDILIKRPIDEQIVPVGHYFEVLSSLVDQSLVGRRYRVKAAPQGGQVTAHRYPVTEEN